MSYPIPNLDDRRFDDLVAEATERMQRHLPEVTHLPPGDPAHAFIDLFSWLTETILYRANLIPERQRLAFLNLL
ncbi:MAG TPA: putative baseplate assembly protein, partial [Candidatus Tenderia sp.]|nr:putative baseplate assembly protein [Candidatus Tenderia sp.]